MILNVNASGLPVSGAGGRMGDMTDARAVLAEVRRVAASSTRPVLLGIVGPPGVGKTHVAGRVCAALERDGVAAGVVAMDGFHLTNRQLDRLGLRERKGAPETFDVTGLVAVLERLRRGGPDPVLVPDYDRVLHEPVPARGRIEAGTRVVVVEGSYLLHDAPGWAEVRGLLDLAWYLDAPDAVRAERLLARHVAGGRTGEEALAWIERVDRPHARLVAAGRSRADIVSDVSATDAQLARG